jgi:hypothetical protein
MNWIRLEGSLYRARRATQPLSPFAAGLPSCSPVSQLVNRALVNTESRMAPNRDRARSRRKLGTGLGLPRGWGGEARGRDIVRMRALRQVRQSLGGGAVVFAGESPAQGVSPVVSFTIRVAGGMVRRMRYARYWVVQLTKTPVWVHVVLVG